MFGIQPLINSDFLPGSPFGNILISTQAFCGLSFYYIIFQTYSSYGINKTISSYANYTISLPAKLLYYIYHYMKEPYYVAITVFYTTLNFSSVFYTTMSSFAMALHSTKAKMMAISSIMSRITPMAMAAVSYFFKKSLKAS